MSDEHRAWLDRALVLREADRPDFDEVDDLYKKIAGTEATTTGGVLAQAELLREFINPKTLPPEEIEGQLIERIVGGLRQLA